MGDEIRLSLIKGGKALPQGGGTGTQGVPLPEASLFPAGFLGDKRPLVLIDGSGRIRDANEAVALLLDQSVDALKSMSVADIVIRMDAAFLDMVFQVLRFGRPVVIEAICIRRNGSWLSVEVVINPPELPSGREGQIYLWLNEVKKPRSSEPISAPSRAKNVELAEVVAGQVAHDFNNLLTPLLAYPDLIRQEVKGNSTVAEYLDIIEKTANDMARLTQQLLALARRGRLGSDVFNVNDVVDQSILTLQPSFPANVDVHLELDANLLPVVGSRDQLRRVIDNLVQNAVEAMGNTGTLTVKTENVYLDTPVGASNALTIGEYVKIIVSDTGSGISDDIRERIFDPFFTTKRGSKKRGSGLGLSIVSGIVNDHRGYIDLESTPGKGSSFFVYIPITRSLDQKGPQYNLPRGVERVMVVDDDRPQVQVLVSILESLGYKAVGASSGEECLALIRGGQRFDLLILDMVMDPGLDGLETFVEVRKRVPDQRAILISGHSKTTQRIARAQELGAGAYLRKPLTIDSLAKAVRDELDRTHKAVPFTGTINGLRILIVDDDPMIRRLFGMIILGEFPDAAIEQTSNGDEALQAFKNGRHDLIIMDLQMPIRDGREAFANIDQLCRQSNWPSPRVIFCTGFTPPESLHAIIHANPIHCLLRKPVKAETLLDSVRQVLKG